MKTSNLGNLGAALFAAAITLTFITPPAARADTVLVADNFTGRTGALAGAPPTNNTGGALAWVNTAGAQFNVTGTSLRMSTVNTGGVALGTLALPAGEIYRLDVSVIFDNVASTGGLWTFGFQSATGSWNNTYDAYANAPQIYADWQGNLQYNYGGNAFTKLTTTAALGTEVTFAIELDTRAAQWTAQFYYNDTALLPGPGAVTPFSIDRLHFGTGWNNVTEVTGLALSVVSPVPEPATGVMLAAGLAAMLALMRRRR